MNTIKKQIGDGQHQQQLYQIRILEDNYTYVLSWGREALVVDPGEAKPVLSLIKKENLILKNIIITHYHADHTGGNMVLKKETDCHIIAPEDERIPMLDRSVDDGEELFFGPFSVEVISTPGHTKPHIIYFFRNLHLLFSGDLLFAGGCGRLFEGSPQEMLSSLEKIALFPEDTVIYCGHEYTVKNLEFAHFIEPENKKVMERLDQAKQLMSQGKPTIPTTLSEEKETNPFLRVNCPSLRKTLNMEEADDITVFTYLRNLKDKF